MISYVGTNTSKSKELEEERKGGEGKMVQRKK